MSILKSIMGNLLEESTLPIELVYWDGDVKKYGKGEAKHKVTFRTPESLKRLIFGLSMGFGEGYTNGDIEIEGDLQEIFALPYTAGLSNPFLSLFTSFSEWVASKKNSNTLSGSKKNITHHYDIGNDFYKLWLDKNLQYTCSYFTDTDTDLDTSQIDKMNYVCNKVDLKEGEKVLETGCGWGGLAVHAAKNYGVKVTAYNISKEQVSHARKLAEEEEVEDLVTFIEDDYRNANGIFDKFISIGMIEHVGKENYRVFTDVIKRTLKEGGKGIVHFIGKITQKRSDSWIEKYIFPGGYTPTLSEVLSPFEKRGLVVRDVENLRLHYARTLDHWTERFENSIDKISETFDERFVRMWRLYLNFSSISFKYGGHALYQIIFTNGLDNADEMTRESLYVAGKNPKIWNYTT